MPLVVRGRLNPGTNFQALDAGSVQNPSVAFRQSQTTGLFLPGDNVLGITSGGQECFRASKEKSVISTAECNVTVQESNVSTHIPFLSANVSPPELTSYNFVEHLDILTLASAANPVSNVSVWGSSVGGTTSSLTPRFKNTPPLIEPLNSHVQLVTSTGTSGPYFNIGSSNIDFATNGSFAAVMNVRVLPGNAGDSVFDFYNDDGDFVRLYRQSVSGTVSFSISARSDVFTVTTPNALLTGDWQTLGCRAYRVTSSSWNLSIWNNGFVVVDTTVTGSLDNVIMTNSYIGRSSTDQYTSLDIREAVWINDVITELAFVSVMSYMQTKYTQLFYSFARNSSFSVESNVSFQEGLSCDATGRVTRVKGLNGFPLDAPGSWHPPNGLRYSIVGILASAQQSSSVQPGLDACMGVESAGFVGSYGFIGSTLLADGRVLCIPHNATVAEVYNPVTQTSMSFGSFPGLNAFAGGILLPNSAVYLIPWSATQARIVDINTYSVTIPNGTFSGSASYYGGAMMNTGELFLSPHNATEAIVYDYRTDTSISVPGYPGLGAYLGCVLLPNGKVLSIPYNQTRGRLYDPTTRVVSLTSATFGSGQALYYGGCLLPSGEVFCIPHNSSRAAIYNPTTDSVRFTSSLFPGNAAFASGTVLPDGRVLCTPWTATRCYVYNPTDDTVSRMAYPFSGLDSHAGATLLLDGSVFLSPCNSTEAAIVHTGNHGHFSLSRNVLTSPFLNSF